MPIPTSYPNPNSQNQGPVPQAVYGAPETAFNSGINDTANYGLNVGFTPQPGK